MKFSDRLDALMNIAEITNSMLGRDVHLSSSYIGRLRSGARPLPKSHEYISSICFYLAKHIRKDYQLNALRQLIKADTELNYDAYALAIMIENWLLSDGEVSSATAERLISAISTLDTSPRKIALSDSAGTIHSRKIKRCFYGNEGKRRAVEQLFIKVLQEETPQTLLFSSDESIEWLYEDSDYAARWIELLTEVISRGNRVKVIHTLARDINEMTEAINKWLPIYTTGKVEPYFYPRIRDGLYQRTLLIAPQTAAVVSTSVQHHTSEMLNLFITDSSAVSALCLEFERHLSLCRSMMRIFTEKDIISLQNTFEELSSREGDAVLCCSTDSDPDVRAQLEHLKDRFDNLKVSYKKSINKDLLIYVKEDSGVIMFRYSDPKVAFLITERNIINALLFLVI